MALLFVIAPTEVHRDFTSDVHVRLHCGEESILIHCFCKIAYCPNFIAVRCIIREIFDSWSDHRSHRRPATRTMRQADRRAAGVVKARLDGGLVNAGPARIGS